jgi:hypothetical protein
MDFHLSKGMEVARPSPIVQGLCMARAWYKAACISQPSASEVTTNGAFSRIE